LSVRATGNATTSDLAAGEKKAYLTTIMQQFDSPHRTPAGPKSGQSVSIVIVDPDPLSLIAMAGVLYTQGYHCTCARSGEAAEQALRADRQDLILWDVADDAAGALEKLAKLRQLAGDALPAVMIATANWAGLESKTDALAQPTRCLFKPIDPHALIAVVDQLLWMPALLSAHRRKGSTPSRAGWLTL